MTANWHEIGTVLPMTCKKEYAIIISSKSGSSTGSTFYYVRKGVCKMKYCPYCGADLIEDAVSFCAECGKQLPARKMQKEKPEDKPKINKESKKKKKKPTKKAESSIEAEPVVDDGYDGYYDDIRPIDEGYEREGVDKELVKKIVTIIAVLFVVIIACVALMYVL